MLAARTRSGLVETYHQGAVAVVSGDGDLIASSGEIDRPFFLRSAAKPFQAVVSQLEGAALQPVELALAAASHDGEPVHVAVVESMLAASGLDSSDLRCPAIWPLSESATRRHQAMGRSQPQRIWHNCSGKHVAWLRACSAGAGPIESYLAPDHPLQTRVARFVTDLGEYPVTPVGVDGCGAPVLLTTTRVMALLYARLATLPVLEEVFSAMHRYPALVSGTGHGDAEVATALNAVAKRGAGGCIGVAIDNRLGLAVKSWDGTQEVADSAMVSTLLALGEIPPHAAAHLLTIARPPVLGGGRPVGELEPLVELTWS
ncbi:MAG TPA: asparaginase [Acidimicrobiia bacterium]|nr:asparaginase [Acidimicrobiia bacterium]